MIENKYIYSLLKYKHSAILDESLNVGLLIYFQNDGSFVFEHSKKLSRIKSIYPIVSDKIIKHYLHQISYRLKRFDNLTDEFIKVELRQSFDYFLSNQILPYDGSSLQFSSSKTNFQYEKNNKEIKKHLIDLFLFEEVDNKANKDYLLAKKFYSNIKNKIDSIDPKYFKKDYKVQNSSGVEFNFNYAWKNGSLNLVKPLNFDLSEAKYISDKAHKNYGLIVDLQDKAEQNDLRFDFLVGRPKRKELFKEYDHSIKLLGGLKRIDIIEEEEISRYSNRALDTLLNK